MLVGATAQRARVVVTLTGEWCPFSARPTGLEVERGSRPIRRSGGLVLHALARASAVWTECQGVKPRVSIMQSAAAARARAAAGQG